MVTSQLNHEGKLFYLTYLQDWDMEPDVLAEAKDIVQAWIDKAGADGAVNMEVSLNN